MKNVIKAEEFAMFMISIYFFSLLDFKWWIFPALILLPDISFVGYAFNPKVGAMVYNFFHHKAVAILIAFIGLIVGNSILQLIGIILFAHSSMDRLFGYGLKYFTGFNDTHLGPIKPSNQ
jgi:hypothetical protein